MGTEILRLVIGDNPPPRLDKALAKAVPEEVTLSRSRIGKMIEAGQVQDARGNVITALKHKAQEGEEYTLTLEAEVVLGDAQPENIPIEIVHEDEVLLVVNKPAGMVTHPAPGSETGTLVNALLHHLGASNAGGGVRPGIVHRIDKDTSGLLVVAKTDEAHEKLSAQFKDHSIHRKYLAVTKGVPSRADPRLQGLKGVAFEDGGLIRIATHIERHKTDRKRMTITHNSGRHAITRIQLLEDFGDAALVACMLETGRTHQIRVHLSHIGHGLIGDPVYGKRRSFAASSGNEIALNFARQALHASELGFIHPQTGSEISFTTDLPADMRNLLQSFATSG